MSFHRPGSSAARRGRRALVLVAALLLVALVVAWLRGSGTEVVTSETPTRGPTLVEPILVPIGDPTDPRRAIAEVGDRLDERSLTTEDAEATPREAIDVLVLDAIARTPVAGAEVRWANAAELGMPTHPREFGVSYDTGIIDRRVEPVLSLERSRRTIADERGVAHVDTRVFPGRISALHGDRSGSVEVGDGMISPIRVYVTEQRAIPIQVVDGAGVPVPGVPVSLRQHPAVDDSAELWLGTSGELGLVRAELAKPRAPESDGWIVDACLEIPLLRPVCVPVDLRNALTEPVRLVLPPFGSVVVDVREKGGRTAQRCYVRLQCVPDGTTPDLEELERSRRFEPAAASGRDARFPFVGLGLDVYPSASRANDYVSMLGDGPRAAGERVRFDLELAGTEPEVTGRLLVDAGHPLRERLVQIVYSTDQFSDFRYPVLTDTDGRFRFFATVPKAPGGKGSLLAMPIGIGPGEGGSVQTAIDDASTDAAHDVGDLVVRGPRVVGRGVVVDDVGTPVPWAYVAVFAPTPWEEWRTNWCLRSVPHGDGTFEILSSIDVSRVRVRAMSPGHAESDFVEFEPGQDDVRLVNARGCKISGRVIEDDAGVPSRIRVHAIGPGPRIEGKIYRQSRVEHGSFAIWPVAPGRYDLEFRRDVRGVKDELVHRLEGIDLPPAGVAVDARLDAVDLRGKTALSAPR